MDFMPNRLSTWTWAWPPPTRTKSFTITLSGDFKRTTAMKHAHGAQDEAQISVVGGAQLVDSYAAGPNLNEAIITAMP